MVENSPANAGDIGDACSILGLRLFPERGNGNSLYYSFLENPMDRGVWWVTVNGVVKESDMT